MECCGFELTRQMLIALSGEPEAFHCAGSEPVGRTRKLNKA